MSKKYVRETTAAKALSAYVILKNGRHVATVQVFHGSTCLVNIWQESAAYIRSAKARKEFTDDNAAYHAYGFQRSTAGGYGYDKLTSALSGMIIDGHELTDHCSRRKAPKPPKGNRLFPRDYKPPRGYGLSNYTTVDRETGRRIYRDEWMKRACEALGLPSDLPISNEDFDRVATLAHEMESEWRASDKSESGYSDCYRESGLDYLKAMGYTIISAI